MTVFERIDLYSDRAYDSLTLCCSETSTRSAEAQARKLQEDLHTQQLQHNRTIQVRVQDIWQQVDRKPSDVILVAPE